MYWMIKYQNYIVNIFLIFKNIFLDSILILKPKITHIIKKKLHQALDYNQMYPKKFKHYHSF